MYSSCQKSLSIKLTAVNRIWMKIFLFLFCWLAILSMQLHTSHKNEVVCLLYLLRLGVRTRCLTGYSEYRVFIFYLHVYTPATWCLEWFVKSELNLGILLWSKLG